MIHGLAGVLLCLSLHAQTGIPTTVAPAAEATSVSDQWSSGEWVGDEDLLFVFQAFTALGAASAVGALALLPAHAAFFVVLIMAVGTQTPGLIIAGPILLIALTVIVQAIVVGLTVWAVGMTSEAFRAPTYLPPLLGNLFKPGKGDEPSATRRMLEIVAGAPWLPGAMGYLVGAGLGIGVGLTLAAPLLAAGLVLANAPVGGPGVVALMLALMAGGVLVAASETLLAPPIAALAYHLTKVPEEGGGGR